MDGRRLFIRAATAALGALVLVCARPGRAVATNAAASAFTYAPTSISTSTPASASTYAPASAPYPPSRIIAGIRWDFRDARPLRKAIGSDIWPCTWARDGALYCAWGDGGGFDGNSDTIGRVSLGFARVTGTPRAGDPASYQGKNVWGAPPYAESRATFGGKVGSMVAVDGVLYAAGSLWTRENAKNPVATWSDGSLQRLIWSADRGKTWRIAPWPSSEYLGGFLNCGRGSANAPNGYVYIYYTRVEDPSHVYLKRVPASELTRAPEQSHAWQYLEFVSRSGAAVSWSPRAVDAVPIFTDPENVNGPSVVYDAGLGRYLMTVGHVPGGHMKNAAPGKLGVFEAPHPWGPWRTVYYGNDWGHFPASTHGDYLGLTFPAKWISADGTTLWGVFSGPGGLDAFNLVEARLVMRPHRARAQRGEWAPSRPAVRDHEPALARCTEHDNAVNRSVFMVCRDESDR